MDISDLFRTYFRVRKNTATAPNSKRIMAEVIDFLYELGEVSGETIFIDGDVNTTRRHYAKAGDEKPNQGTSGTARALSFSFLAIYDILNML